MRHHLIRVFSVCAVLIVVSANWAVCKAEEPEKAPKAADVSREFDAAAQQKDYAKAIELGRKLAELLPGDSEVAYNNACVCALMDNKADALKWLKKSVESGLADLELISTDADLASLRRGPDLAAIIDGVRKNRERASEEMKKRANETPPFFIAPDKLDKSKPAPLIVALHGYGDREELIAAIWRDVAEQFGAVIVAPRGPYSTLDGGYRWGDLEDNEYVVNLALERAKKQYNIDPKKMILTGFSQGGAAAYNLGLRHPELWRGVIPVAGSYQPETARLPEGTGESKPKFYIIVGDKDSTLESNKTAAKDLEAAGVPVQIRVVENTRHTYPKDRILEFQKAMKFVLGG